MLRIVTGPFQPTLEQALVHRLQEIKGQTPLAPLSIVLPSESLRRYIQWNLATQNTLPLLNVHFFTFYQFAQKLLDEPLAQGELVQPIHITSVTIFKEVIHHFLRFRLPEASPLKQFIHMPGAWAALWSTFKDLKDAGIPRETESIKEVLLQKTDIVKKVRGRILTDLLTVYADLQREMHHSHIGDYEDLSVQAKERVSTSQFLQNQHEILYYGFYDLTQIQLDFFHQVVREYPSQCFFPLVSGDPSYLFAERFLDRYIRGFAADEAGVPRSLDHRQDPLPSNPHCRVLNVRGHTQELEVVAKEILALVEERGYAFQDIGVIARSMTGYEHILPAVFLQHHIPFQSSLGQPLSHYPFVQTVIQLLTIPASGFRANDILTFLSSQFVRLSSLSQSGQEYPDTFRSDHWQSLRERLGIQEGLEPWMRLTSFLETGISLGTSTSDSHEASHLTGEQLQWMLEAIPILHAQLASFSEQGSWSFYIEKLRECMDTLLNPLFMEEHLATYYASQDILLTVSRCLDQLQVMRHFVDDVPFSEFVHAARRIFEETIFSEGSLNGQGVQVLDAMEARGLSFRAVFLLGLNESVFPRPIQEDAFLRDDVRRILETDLGYKISEKMDAYHEEELLFSLVTSSATHDLTLLYLRSDDEGRTALPSSYLERWKARSGGATMVTIPTQQAQRSQQGRSYPPERLTQEEFLIEALLRREIHTVFLETLSSQGQWLSHCLEAIRTLDEQAPLGRYDGITGALDTFWAQTCAKGFSPTALERYAICPFQYFSRHVLRLKPVGETMETMDVAPRERGLLIHAILRRTMEALQSQGFFRDKGHKAIDPNLMLERMATEEFQQFAEVQFTGFPLLWELQQEEILFFLRHVLKQDLAELKEKDWEPVLFEKEMIGTLSLENTVHDGLIKIRGFLDRVDRSLNNNAYRIVDYKYKVSRNAGTLDKNLALAAIRGIHLQPPLYLKMVEDGHGQRIQQITLLNDESKCDGVWFYYLAPYWNEKGREGLFPIAFPENGWQPPLGPAMLHTISHILQGIQQGQFYITPGPQCDSCDYRLLCRNNHQPTLLRARRDPLRTRLVQHIKKAQLPKT